MSHSSRVVTVAICTYNRASSLRRTLESVVAMETPEAARWELLVIDNNSDDGTQKVVAEFESRLPLRCAVETAQGLSHARNRAIRECLGETLLFTDDDVRLGRSWLSAYLASFSAYPEADYFGGKVVPFWPAGRPRWLVDDRLGLISGLLLHYDLGDEVRPYTDEDPLPYGASMAIRRRLFAEAGEFDAALGPIGTVPGRGDDAEYIARARSNGSVGCYVGTAVAHHETDPERLKLGYLYRYGVQKGIAFARLEPQERPDRLPGRGLAFLLRGLVQLLRGRGDRFRQCVINMGIHVGMKQEHRRSRVRSG